MPTIHQRTSSEKVLSEFRTTIDSILCYRNMFPVVGGHDVDNYLARVRYYRRFGKSLQDAREMAFINDIQPL